MDKVTVRLTGPNLRNGPVVGVLTLGDIMSLNIEAEDCEVPSKTNHYTFVFEVLEITNE